MDAQQAKGGQGGDGMPSSGGILALGAVGAGTEDLSHRARSLWSATLPAVLGRRCGGALAPGI